MSIPVMGLLAFASATASSLGFAVLLMLLVRPRGASEDALCCGA